jgi:uncharacterized membrane protein
MLTATGVAHFVLPRFYDPIIPHALPGTARSWVLASGAAELAVAAAVAAKRSRRAGATVAAVLFIAVFPANVQMAVNWSRRSALESTLAWVRLPMQVPLVWWALRVRRASTSDAVRTCSKNLDLGSGQAQTGC